MPVPVGLNTWSRLVGDLFPYLDQVVAPFDSLWFPDHVQYGDATVAEGWSLLAYALARYPDKICGHDVLCNSFRNPAHLAKMAATMQIISGGRVVVGIGAGWNEEEYRAYGWPFPSARVRIAQLAESIQILRKLWTETPVTFHGEHYQLDVAYCEPKPDPAPPIMVGGKGEKYLLRVVAQHADWWNYVYEDRETYAHKQRVLQDHCAAVGREYDEIRQVIHVGILIGENEREVERQLADPAVRPVDASTLVGTPQEITAGLLSIVEQGAARITIHVCDAPRPEGTQLFAASVLPHLAKITPGPQ
ncbi:MAG: LLM class flavin-dependent oxidoreductase [Caldilineaceae bacterium]|nr:LLM class flavin-dependent oxidoreductase [Caldilineaceae bacterium]